MKIKPWEKLTRKEQDLYLTVLWQDGYSEQAIADFLLTTKGRIVRRRQTGLKLSSIGRNRKTGPVEKERLADLLDLNDMEDLEAKGISSIAPPSPHEIEPDGEALQPEETPAAPASKEAEGPRCQWPLPDSTKLRPHVCGKPAAAGHMLCEEHLAMISKYK